MVHGGKKLHDFLRLHAGNADRGVNAHGRRIIVVTYPDRVPPHHPLLIRLRGPKADTGRGHHLE
jgi:hypothetical protein